MECFDSRLWPSVHQSLLKPQRRCSAVAACADGRQRSAISKWVLVHSVFIPPACPPMLLCVLVHLLVCALRTADREADYQSSQLKFGEQPKNCKKKIIIIRVCFPPQLFPAIIYIQFHISIYILYGYLYL